jgi:glycosyltransferase involved in cell wall biosynthesis
MRRFPIISVVVPTRNSARYLGDALSSLVAQTGADFEVIVVDGASTDSTVEVIKRYHPMLPLRWLSEPDSGQTEAINKGLRLAQGEVLSWLNSDDTLASDTLAKVARRFAEEPDLEMLSGLGVLTNPVGGFLRVIPETPIQRVEDLYRFGCHICQPSTFLRRTVLDRHGLLDTTYHLAMDFEYWLRIGRSVRFRFVPEIFSCFRLHSDSKTVSQQGRFWREEKRAFRRHGGSWRSPFFLAHFYDSKVVWASYLLAAPLRWITWPLFGLSRSEWLRPGPPPLLETESAWRDSDPDRAPSGRVD